MKCRDENRNAEGVHGYGFKEIAKEIRKREIKVAEDTGVINCTQWKLSRDRSQPQESGKGIR